MNCLKNKFTFKFLKIMIINEIFIILNVLKKYFFSINNCLNNIRHDETKKTIKIKHVLLRNSLEKKIFVQQLYSRV